MIELERLVKKFGDMVAVDGISLRASAGEVIALLGPNGAGKTTTVRVLAAVLKPTSGRVRVMGYDTVENPREVRHAVGLLTEVPGLYRRMSSLKYLDFFGQLQRMPKGDRDGRIAFLLDKFGLWEDRKKPLGSYSKGMRQKLALIRALLHEPQVLLLDEPTSALDPTSSRIVHDHILDLKRDRRRTIIVCTHNLAEAQELADRVAILSKGRILELGTVEELSRRFLGDPIFALHSRGGFTSSDFLRLLGDLVEPEGQDGEVIRYRVEDPERINPILTRRLMEKGVEIVSLSEVERSLEAIYLRIAEGSSEAQV
jgi:ABC-2 type transport system ATP-binding protein